MANQSVVSVHASKLIHFELGDEGLLIRTKCLEIRKLEEENLWKPIKVFEWSSLGLTSSSGLEVFGNTVQFRDHTYHSLCIITNCTERSECILASYSWLNDTACIFGRVRSTSSCKSVVFADGPFLFLPNEDFSIVNLQNLEGDSAFQPQHLNCSVIGRAKAIPCIAVSAEKQLYFCCKSEGENISRTYVFMLTDVSIMACKDVTTKFFPLDYRDKINNVTLSIISEGTSELKNVCCLVTTDQIVYLRNGNPLKAVFHSNSTSKLLMEMPTQDLYNELFLLHGELEDENCLLIQGNESSYLLHLNTMKVKSIYSNVHHVLYGSDGSVFLDSSNAKDELFSEYILISKGQTTFHPQEAEVSSIEDSVLSSLQLHAKNIERQILASERHYHQQLQLLSKILQTNSSTPSNCATIPLLQVKSEPLFDPSTGLDVDGTSQARCLLSVSDPWLVYCSRVVFVGITVFNNSAHTVSGLSLSVSDDSGARIEWRSSTADSTGSIHSINKLTTVEPSRTRQICVRLNVTPRHTNSLSVWLRYDSGVLYGGKINLSHKKILDQCSGIGATVPYQIRESTSMYGERLESVLSCLACVRIELSSRLTVLEMPTIPLLQHCTLLPGFVGTPGSQLDMCCLKAILFNDFTASMNFHYSFPEQLDLFLSLLRVNVPEGVTVSCDKPSNEHRSMHSALKEELRLKLESVHTLLNSSESISESTGCSQTENDNVARISRRANDIRRSRDRTNMSRPNVKLYKELCTKVLTAESLTDQMLTNDQ